MIYDLDTGGPERPALSSVRMTAITVIAVGIALVFVTALAFAPGQRENQTPIFTFSAPALPTLPRPTFVTRPVPDRTLWLSRDVARITYRITNSGFTGLIPSDSIMTTYQLAASGDLVNVAWLFPDEVLPYPSPSPNAAKLRIRGHEASWLVSGGTTSIRWLEFGMVFELSSRTLSVAQLADIASQLR